MSVPVDVLAIMDAWRTNHPVAVIELSVARQRIADLIDSASRVSSHGTRSATQVNDDWDRLRLALARVKGEQS